MCISGAANAALVPPTPWQTKRREHGIQLSDLSSHLCQNWGRLEIPGTLT